MGIMPAVHRGCVICQPVVWAMQADTGVSCSRGIYASEQILVSVTERSVLLVDPATNGR